jgi:hypothetical protein
MIATIAFFSTIRARIDARSLASYVGWAVYNNLIAAISLHLISKKTKSYKKFSGENHESYFSMSWQGMGYYFMALNNSYH